MNVLCCWPWLKKKKISPTNFNSFITLFFFSFFPPLIWELKFLKLKNKWVNFFFVKDFEKHVKKKNTLSGKFYHFIAFINPTVFEIFYNYQALLWFFYFRKLYIYILQAQFRKNRRRTCCPKWVHQCVRMCKPMCIYTYYHLSFHHFIPLGTYFS